MANTTIQLKHSTLTGNVPSSLANGEISINNRDGKFFYSTPAGVVVTHYPYIGPAGLNQEIQFNDSGVLGSDAGLTYNKTSGLLQTTNVTASNVTTKTFIQFGDGTKQYTANAGSGNGGGTNAAIDRKTYTATTAQTSFAINYSSPYVLVSINGVAIDPTEYTATNNTSITLVTGTRSGDVIDLLGFSGNAATAIDQSAREIANSASIYANGAFTAANSGSGSSSAGPYANAAFSVANSASIYANSAFLTANSADAKGTSAGSYANSAFLQANTPSYVANSASNYANSGFAVANSASYYSNGSFATANSASIYANGAFTRANNSINANTGGTITGDILITGNLVIQGNTFTANAGILVANDTLFVLGTGNYVSDVLDIGFAGHYNDGTNAHVGFIRDVGTKEWYLFKNYTPEIGANNNIDINDPSFTIDTLNANVKSTVITLNGINLLPYVNNSYTQANTPSHVANSAASYANSAFASANNIDGINLTQNTNITNAGTYANSGFAVANSAASYANSAFIRANNSINANTGGVVTGLLNVTSNIVTTNLTVTSNATSNLGAVKLIGSPSGTNLNTGLLQIGIPLLFNDTDILFSATHSVNSYAQFILQNQNSGTRASSDYIVNNDRPGGTAIYGDFGINSSTYDGPSPFNLADGTYLYGAGGSLTVGTNGAQDFRIATNDTLRANIQASTGKMHTLNDFEIGGILTAKSGGTITGNLVVSGSNIAVSNGATEVFNVRSHSTSGLPSTSNSTGTVTIIGGMGVRGNVYTDNTSTSNITVTGNTSTGNLIVSGLSPGKVRTISFVIDGAGSVITTGQKGNVMVDFAGTIDAWTILGDASGTCTVDVSKASYTNFPTFTASGGTSPALSSQQKNQNVGINWTGFTTVSANDIIRFVVSGTPATVTSVTVALKITSTT